MRKLVMLLLFCASPAWSAKCWVSEYASTASDASGRVVPVAAEPALNVGATPVTYTASAQSAVFNANTRFIRVICDATAHYLVGTAPVADADDPYLPANATEYFAVPRGASFRIAFYDGTT